MIWNDDLYDFQIIYFISSKAEEGTSYKLEFQFINEKTIEVLLSPRMVT